MRLSAMLITCWIATAVVCCQAQEAPVAEAAGEDVEIVVPEGDAATLIQFIEKVANPANPPQSRDAMRAYMRKVSGVISEAATKILESDATDEQLVDGVEWKLESFRVRRALGDRTAGQDEDAFYGSMANDERMAVVKAVKRARLREKVNTWPRLDPKLQAELVNDFVEVVKSEGATWEDAMVSMRFGRIADFGGGELASNALNELLPLFRKSSDPQLRQMLPNLEAQARFLNLIGNKLDLEGTLLDGTELDWESYRGKVVLVDFWATWCGPCRAEVPNVLANYEAYHAKGFEVLGISLDDTRQEAEKYIQQNKLPWKTVFSGKPGETGWAAPMAVRYAVNAIPRAILVDQEGIVVHLVARGPLLGQKLQELLGGPATDELGDQTTKGDEVTVASAVQE